MYSVWLTGTANGARVRHWIRTKKGGWYAVLEAARMAVISTLVDQAHNVVDRKRFMMKAYPTGSQQAFLRGLAHLYNLVPYQTRDWSLNLHILTSGGFR